MLNTFLKYRTLKCVVLVFDAKFAGNGSFWSIFGYMMSVASAQFGDINSKH